MPIALRLLPRSLAARTALVLLAGLVVVQLVGLAIHALDRIDFARLNNEREVGAEVAGIYRMVADASPAARDDELQRAHLPAGFHAVLTTVPVLGRLRPAPEPIPAHPACTTCSRCRSRSRLRPTQVVIANNLAGGMPSGPYDGERPLEGLPGGLPRKPAWGLAWGSSRSGARSCRPGAACIRRDRRRTGREGAPGERHRFGESRSQASDAPTPSPCSCRTTTAGWTVRFVMPLGPTRSCRRPCRSRSW